MFSCGLYCFTGCDSVLYDVPVCESRFHYSTLPCALSHDIPCYVMFLISACSIPQIYFFIFCTLYHVLLYLPMLCYAMFYRITPYYGASYCSVIHHVILCFTMFFYYDLSQLIFILCVISRFWSSCRFIVLYHEICTYVYTHMCVCYALVFMLSI